MRRVVTALALALSLVAMPAAAQNLAIVDRPLATDTAQVVESGHVLAGIGAEHVRLPGQETLTSVPVVGARVGIAGIAEFSATYRWLWREARDLPDANGTGDLYLFGKLRLLDGLDGEGRPSLVPAAAVRVGVKLPNASADDRLGTNNTDFSVTGLVTPRYGPLEIRLAGGLLIIESPTDPLAQTDAFAYSAALLLDLPGGIVPFVEYYEQTANSPAFDFAEGRLGARWTRGSFGLDVSGSLGLTGSRPLGFAGELSRSWGVAAGVTYRFSLPGFGRSWGRANGGPATGNAR